MLCSSCLACRFRPNLTRSVQFKAVRATMCCASRALLGSFGPQIFVVQRWLFGMEQDITQVFPVCNMWLSIMKWKVPHLSGSAQNRQVLPNAVCKSSISRAVVGNPYQMVRNILGYRVLFSKQFPPPPLSIPQAEVKALWSRSVGYPHNFMCRAFSIHLLRKSLLSEQKR